MTQTQLEIREIWTPNLVIAKYNINRKEKESKRIYILGYDSEEIEYNEYIEYISPLKKYLNNIVDLDDRVILSSKNLKEIMKPGDIIQTEYICNNESFKLNDNTTLFIFYAHKALYPKILAEKVKPEIFDSLNDTIKPSDMLFFKIYITLRSADISFKRLRNVWDILYDRIEEYLNDINAIKNSLENQYKEYIRNFFIHHFPFDNYITKDMFDNKTIDTLIDNLEPLRIMKKVKKKRGEIEYIEETEYILDIKLPEGNDVYKDFVTFKEKAIKSLGQDNPLIKAYFNSIKGITYNGN